MALELAVAGLHDQDLRLAFGAEIALAKFVRHQSAFFSSGPPRGCPQHASGPVGALTTTTSVPHSPHFNLTPALGRSAIDHAPSDDSVAPSCCLTGLAPKPGDSTPRTAGATCPRSSSTCRSTRSSGMPAIDAHG